MQIFIRLILSLFIMSAHVKACHKSITDEEYYYGMLTGYQHFR